MPLSPRGFVRLGTIVASVSATMCDSAFVLMSVMPFHYLLVSIFSFIVAIIVGYLVDQTTIGEQLLENINLKQKQRQEEHLSKKEEDHLLQAYETGRTADSLKHIGHREGEIGRAHV